MIIKQQPEDFIVKENLRLNFDDNGKVSYFLLRKKNWNTVDAVNKIAKMLHVKRVNFAGLKDKQAVTEQVISIDNVLPEKVEGLKINDIELEFIGKGNERVNSSLITSNSFIITVRGLETRLPEPPAFMPNYFGEQRFGVKLNNHLAGKAIIKKNFKEACEILGLRTDNPINALNSNSYILKLSFNAYQSYLFNLVLAKYLKKHYEDVFEQDEFVFVKGLNTVKNFYLPLIQFDTVLENEARIYHDILKQEGVKQSDFLVRELPYVINLTDQRLAFVKVENFVTREFNDDELNNGKKKQVISFGLPRGSYATVLLKELTALAFQ